MTKRKRRKCSERQRKTLSVSSIKEGILHHSCRQSHSTAINGSDDAAAPDSQKTSAATAFMNNPLLEQQNVFLESLNRFERDHLFSPMFDSNRRGEIWMKQANIGERLINRYSWATPDEQALRILKHFSPLIEIGCGAQAYWCSLMEATGVDVIGYDFDPSRGGTIDKATISQNRFSVRHGGPEVLMNPEHAGRSLFLCYPDENGNSEINHCNDESNPPQSLASACLDHYQGEIVIHVGELFTDTTLAIDQAPWGRSSSPEFQQQLASTFHCLLKVNIPSWLHVRDSISVWKRSESCAIVFECSDDGNDSDTEEVIFRHVPLEEMLPASIAAPCLAHLVLERKHEHATTIR